MCGDRARKSAEEKIDATCLAVAVVTVAVSAVVSQRLPEAPRGLQRLPVLVVALLDPRHPGPYITL